MQPEPTAPPAPKPVPRSLRLIGHSDLGGKGFNGDVWSHKDHAYVGTWGGVYDEEAPCPATGVKVVDLSDPTRPRMVARLKTMPGATAEDVVVVSAQTPHFRGDIAAVGLQPCDFPGTSARGVQLFDVTNPARPKPLGRWDAPRDTVGCHEVDMVARRDVLLIGCASPFSSQRGEGEAVLINATNPNNPTVALDYVHRNIPASAARGCLDFSIVHNVRFAAGGTQAYLSYWDAGTVILDITKVRTPKVIGHLEREPRGPDGDNHSVSFAPGDVVLVNHEDFSPARPEARFGGCGPSLGGWGKISIWDMTRPARPKRLSVFGTKRSDKRKMTNANIFTVHNTEVAGGSDVFASWYSDGIRWIDISRPRRPREVASFIPPARRDPQGFFRKTVLMWGVHPIPARGLVLGSDINGGLYVLRATGMASG